MVCSTFISFFFFCNATAPTEIYTLSLHDALPISVLGSEGFQGQFDGLFGIGMVERNHKRSYSPVESQTFDHAKDRKSTRLNSSHMSISYAVFCLKKKKKNIRDNDITA